MQERCEYVWILKSKEMLLSCKSSLKVLAQVGPSEVHFSEVNTIYRFNWHHRICCAVLPGNLYFLMVVIKICLSGIKQMKIVAKGHKLQTSLCLHRCTGSYSCYSLMSDPITVNNGLALNQQPGEDFWSDTQSFFILPTQPWFYLMSTIKLSVRFWNFSWCFCFTVGFFHDLD